MKAIHHTSPKTIGQRDVGAVSDFTVKSLHYLSGENLMSFNRAIDPIFAVSVGVTAAAVRINREEKEKGRTTEDTIDALKRRTAMLFDSKKSNMEEKAGKASR